MSVPDFHVNDGIEARCGLCGASVREPLSGKYDRPVVDRAMKACTDWMRAHLEHFHPDIEKAP